MKYLQNQESFSFSASSKTGLFSYDDDGDADVHNHAQARISSHHQSDYFEISLSPPTPSPSATKIGDSKEEEFEFCFSFNSSLTHVDFPTTPVSASSNHSFHHHEPPMTTTAFVASQLVNVVDKKRNQCNKVNNLTSYKRIFQNATSPRCHKGLISPYIFPPSRLRTYDETQRGLVKKRNLTKLGGIKKFIVKLRSIKSVFRSSLNASRRFQQSTKIEVNRNNRTTSVDHRQKGYNHITNKSIDSIDIITSIHSQKRDSEEEKCSRRMNFNGFSKMFDVILKNIRTTRRSIDAHSKSCPVSVKSSPMHDTNVGNARDERRNSFYIRDHSIQAAIAHCKKSLFDK